MRKSTDENLLWIAKQALNIEWPELSEDLKRLHVGLTGSGKLPKHVKQLPSGERFYVVGLFLSGKYRPLAYLSNSLHAALLADCIILRVDEFLKRGIRSDAAAQRIALNFPIEYSQDILTTSESIGAWWSEVLSHLVSESILVETEERSGPLRSGRPKTVSIERFECLEKQIWEMNHKLDTILSHLAMTHVIIGPSNPATPTQPAIGWPLPAAPTCPSDYPIITCGDAANAPKPT